jgi:hypothetical protein
VNLIEIDLLRGGERPKLSRPLQADADYAVLLHRGSDRPKTLVWQFTLRNRIPQVPVPLTSPDADVPLDLQHAVQSIYDEYGYPLRAPYHKSLRPAPRPGDEAWIQELLKQV